MFSFQPVFFLTLLTGASASLPKLVSYEPQTNVADHASISQDQQAIEAFVGFSDEASFDTAEAVYRQGGNSKSFAEITLAAGLPQSIKKGVSMTGTTTAGTTVTGAAYADYAQGVLTVGLQYPTGDQYGSHVNCRVGGLPTELQVTTGCLAPASTITITGIAAAQAYTTVENKNGRTIAGFSTGAATRFKPGDNPSAEYFPFFEDYITYYGSADFADEIATAGFNGGDTNLDKGNVRVSGYGFPARAEIAKKATAYLNTGLYVQRELWDALFDCEEQCATADCNDDAVHALDEAVAFYVGSEFVADPDGYGNFFYGFAQKRAENFATAADAAAGQAEVNRKIMTEFNKMKSMLNAGQCTESEDNANEIVRLMMIPFVQGSLRYAYLADAAVNPTEKTMAEGAVFAAGILPKVNKCDPDAATTIYENMRLTASQTSNADFAAVKRAFESVYSCLQLSCEDIGGLVDPATGSTYLTGAAPCGGVNSFSSAGAMSLSLMVGAVAGVAALFM